MCEPLKMLRDLVVNDYFTPNIKAEVILDTLLTPYVPQILRNECSIDAVFLTKEMSLESVEENGGQPVNDRGSKIDYLLAGKEYVYLVELKTTAGSIESDQTKRYIKYCCDEKYRPGTFGRVFGDKLLRILRKKYTFSGKGSVDGDWNRDHLPAVFDETVGKGTGKDHALRARCYLRRTNRASTYKYLYTAGQILDHCSEASGPEGVKQKLEELWNKEIRLIYITPDGESPHKDLLECRGFYIHPDDTGSICLKRAVKELKAGCGREEPYVQMLKNVIMEIYR